MPRLSIWLIRAALIYLLLGFTVGGLLLWHKGLPLNPALWRLLPAHMEFLLMGWIVHLVMGVAYWILPRFQTKRPLSALVWLSFCLLNGGIWLISISTFVAFAPTIQLVGRIAEVGAIMAFAVHAWPRIKPTSL
ncbi:MAG: hypothetical protein KDE46_28575 [Caldilineaceae bacterium]|nr:hypothetical protein [Caldilineaceae bacterium]MCB9151037.1 hypothetical protein [Caldilineaceae bacterium]MCB9157423.1 hypothetical protein [Caldilineaceae bacterium]